MSKIIITTESSADLPKKWLDEYQIRTVPFSVNFPDRTVEDNSIPVEEIYAFYDQTKQIPKTSAVNPYQYTELFENITAQHPDSEIIHIGYSSVCSCSFQNAVIGAAGCAHARVHLIDSKNVSGGLGNLVMIAARLSAANPTDSAAALAAKIKTYVPKIHTSFVPNRLDFLLAGGRVSNAAAIGAALFKIKPRIDIIDGALIAGKKYIGMMPGIIPTFIRDFTEGRNFDKERVYLFYSLGAKESVIERARSYLLDYGFKQVDILPLGCVMTVHGGKAAIGISALEI